MTKAVFIAVILSVSLTLNIVSLLSYLERHNVDIVKGSIQKIADIAENNQHGYDENTRKEFANLVKRMDQLNTKGK